MIAHQPHLNGRISRLLFIALLAILLLVSSTTLGSWAAAAPKDNAPGNSGIVHSVVKAPIVPDGNVAGAMTDLVINLDRSLDPSVPGRVLATGNQIRVTLPDDFINTYQLPVKSAFTPDCSPITGWNCTTGVLLQGWPQHPILPGPTPESPGPTVYSFSLDPSDDHTLVYEALVDVVPGLPAPGPGIKGMHLIALGFRNPGPGAYDIEVAAQTGPGGAWEYGTGRVHILPRSRPSMNVTSVYTGVPGNPNTIYQTTGVNQETPLPYDFFMWDYDNEPFIGVDIEMHPSGRHGWMEQNGRIVGHVRIDAPRGASGQTVTTAGPSFPQNAFLLGISSARLTAQFTAGDEPGLYTITFSLNGGTSAKMFVTVEE